MMLAFSAKPEELDILMVSLTFGNVDVQRWASAFFLCPVLPINPIQPRLHPPNLLIITVISGRAWNKKKKYWWANWSCLRNVVTLFHHIEKERAWRESKGRPKGFEMLDVRKPIGMWQIVIILSKFLGLRASLCSCYWRWRATRRTYDGRGLLS
jgi:hypothetical protein